jgi:uncharacterized C2H2 Zn-finger protein
MQFTPETFIVLIALIGFLAYLGGDAWKRRQRVSSHWLVCPHCGHFYREGLTFCPNCGEVVAHGSGRR